MYICIILFSHTVLLTVCKRKHETKSILLLYEYLYTLLYFFFAFQKIRRERRMGIEFPIEIIRFANITLLSIVVKHYMRSITFYYIDKYIYLYKSPMIIDFFPKITRYFQILYNCSCHRRIKPTYDCDL